jgi:hypothetical protein
MSASHMSVNSTSTGGTWAIQRPTFLSKVGLQGLSDYIQQYIYIPDFGPPPDWLPLFLHSFWPTGGVRSRGAGGVAVYGGGSTTMSTVSFDDASQMRSGALSPTRSVVSMSGVSGYGKGGQKAAASIVPDEPPFLYGKYNTDAFFGDVAMAFPGEGTSRLRPASVRATGPIYVCMSVCMSVCIGMFVCIVRFYSSSPYVARLLTLRKPTTDFSLTFSPPPPPSVSLAVTVYCLAREITEYVRVLRIGRKTLEELATEFPHDIGKMLNDMALKGRRNMARMRWRMVWGKVH